MRPSGPAHFGQRAGAQGDRGRTIAITGQLGIVLGGGFAAVALYEGFVKRDERGTSHVALTPIVAPGRTGAVLTIAW